MPEVWRRTLGCKEEHPTEEGRTSDLQYLSCWSQLQALWLHPDHTEKMRWRDERTKEILNQLKETDGVPDVYEDILHGKQYLDACQSGKVKDGDSVLMFLIDGAQLYPNSQIVGSTYGFYSIMHPRNGIRRSTSFPGVSFLDLRSPTTSTPSYFRVYTTSAPFKLKDS
jgi:hypothetical protein